MTQLKFDFGPEHPYNEPVIRRNRCYAWIRDVAVKSLAEDITGVQPLPESTAKIFTINPIYTPIPDPADFELTEPFSERDFEHGCFGPACKRHKWERAK